MKSRIVLLFIFIVSTPIFAQSDFDSPYSIFGVGKENSALFGNSNSMGNTGIAYSSANLLNNVNPASLTQIQPGVFLYEIGVNNTFSNKQDSESSQNNNNFNFTNIGFGFSVTNKWKMSIGMIPKTKVSYEIDVVQPIEGSVYYYNTNIVGSGGVSEVYWAQGYKLTKNLSVGLQLMAYFGSVDQDKTITYESVAVTLEEQNSYNGLGAQAGFQYKMNNFLGSKSTTIGAIVRAPTLLNGTQDVEGEKTYYGVGSTSIADDTDDIDDFELPLKIGFGISSKIKDYTINLDYQKSFWSDSYKSNSSYLYNDQNFYGLGVEYNPSANLYKFWNKVSYRVGLNYDSGYLTISDEKINSYGFSAGLGIPFSKNTFSMLNLTYSYGREGTLNKDLILDNFHKLSLNLSLNGRWFQKTKIF